MEKKLYVCVWERDFILFECGEIIGKKAERRGQGVEEWVKKGGEEKKKKANKQGMEEVSK